MKSTELKHTPGPWEYLDKNGPNGKAWGVGQQAKPGKGVAIVIQSEDDARLIAAAPDLLSALRNLVTQIQADGPIQIATARKILSQLDGGPSVSTTSDSDTASG